METLRDVNSKKIFKMQEASGDVNPLSIFFFFFLR